MNTGLPSAEDLVWTGRLVVLSLGGALLVGLGLIADGALWAWWLNRRTGSAAWLERLRARPWSWPEALRIGAMLWAVAAAVSLLLKVLFPGGAVRDGATSGEGTGVPLELLALSQIISFHGGALAFVAARLRARRLTWREAFAANALSRPHPGLQGVFFYLAVIPPFLLVGLLSRLILTRMGCEIEPQAVVEILLSAETPPALRWMVGLAAVSVAPLAEEVLFRGVALPCLLRCVRPSLAVLAVSVLFAAMHSNLGAVGPLIVLSIGLCLSYLQSGTIVTPIVMHAAFNSVNLFVMLLAPDWMIGMATGGFLP